MLLVPFVPVVIVDGAGVGMSRPVASPCVRGLVEVGVASGSEILSFEPARGEEMEMERFAACFVLDQVRFRRDFLRLLGGSFVFVWVRLRSML